MDVLAPSPVTTPVRDRGCLPALAPASCVCVSLSLSLSLSLSFCVVVGLCFFFCSLVLSQLLSQSGVLRPKPSQMLLSSPVRLESNALDSRIRGQ